MKSFKKGKSRNSPESDESNFKRNVSSLGERHKRPDKQLYVPRALRGFQNDPSSTEDKWEEKSPIPKSQDLFTQSVESNSIADCNDSFTSDLMCSSQPVDNSLTVPCDNLEMENINLSSSYSENMNTNAISIQTILEQDNIKKLQNNHLLDVSKDFVTKHPTDNLNSSEVHTCDDMFKDDQVSCVLSNAQKHKEEMYETDISPDSTNIAYTVKNVDVCDRIVTETYNQIKLSSEDEDPDSWETKFNDDGECLNPDVIKELSSVMGATKIHAAQKSYSEYQPISESVSGEYDNIVELHDFPKEFTTADLVSALSFFEQSSYTIKWVDDCHALALFSSSAIVNQALQLNHPFVKVRPLSEGISESKAKARWCANSREPSKPRPATSAVLARRLVSGALGLKVQTTKEQRETERNMLKEAKEKRKLKAKQRQDIWDGLV